MDGSCGFGRSVGAEPSRVLAAFGKSPKLRKHAKPDIVRWVFAEMPVVAIPVTDHASMRRLKVRLIVSDESTIKRRIERWQMRFNGFENLYDVLARQLEYERDNPGFLR